jgi:outer membrane receptor protein involved in Fe transport
MLAAAATGVVAADAAAQEARTIAVRDSTGSRSSWFSGDLLSRLVSIHVVDVPLEAALRLLAQRCALRLSYSSDVVPVARRVSLSRHNAPVGEVLRDLLRGTDIDVVVTPSGYVVLVRNPLSQAAVSAGDSQPAAPIAEPVTARPLLRAQVMDRVLVMGTPASGAPERELSSAVTVMTSSQIAALGPATMEDLFRSGIPGIVAWDLGISGPFAQLGSIRGSSSFTANYLKTYLDGVELASPYLLFAIDPYSIERIEVIRGPQGSALYGSDAISGVVHVVTRRGSAAARWRPQVDALLSGGMVESRYIDGSTGAQRHSAMVSSGGGTSSLGLGGTWSTAGEVVPGGGSAYRGTFGGFRHLAGIMRVEGTARYADIRYSAPRNPLLGNDPELESARPVVLEDQRIENETYGLTIDVRPWDFAQYTLVAGLDRHAGAIPPQREPATVADALLGATRERASKTSLRLSTSLRLLDRERAGASITLGTDRTELSRDRLGDRAALAGAGEGVTALYHDDIDNAGVFALLKVSALRTVFLTAGLRGDWNSTFGESSGTAWSPMVGAAASRDLGITTVKLRGAYGKGIRPPPPSARQAITTVAYRQQANPLLEPETQSGFEGGLELFHGDRAWVSLTGYTQDADGLIQQVILNRNTTRAIQYQNVGRIANRGLEVEGSIRRGGLRANLTYALTDSRVRALSHTYSGDLAVGDRVPEVPGASGAASLSWQVGRAEASFGVLYIGAWTGYDWEQYVEDETSPTESRPQVRSYRREYPSLAKPFLSISQTLSRDFSWFGRIDNLTNVQRNERDNLQITAGRTMTLGLRIGR